MTKAPRTADDTHEQGEHDMERAPRIAEICREASTCWDPSAKSHGTDEGRARRLALEMHELRDQLAVDVLELSSTANDGHLLRTPPTLPQMNSGRWREATWIDLLYSKDIDGRPIDFDKMSKTDRPANLFRVWFTAAGTGFGLRLAYKKDVPNPLCDLAPDGYPNLTPSSSGEHRHDLRLAGVRGRFHTYLAHWVDGGCTSDAEFAEHVSRSWSDLWELLHGHRTL